MVFNGEEKNILQWHARIPLAKFLPLSAQRILSLSNLPGVRKTNAYAVIETPDHLSVRKSVMEEIGPGVLTFYCSKTTYGSG